MAGKRSSQVIAPGSPNFELHTLGWRGFQDLCIAILSEIWGQSVQAFADTRDGGRDGAFYGAFRGSVALEFASGPTVIQCKFLARRDQTLSLSSLSDELSKIPALVSRGLCDSYILMTNARVTGESDALIREAIVREGVKRPLVLNGHWINHAISANQRLRMFVPRVYGLGDLSQILDTRSYDQAKALLGYLKDELATFVVTDAYKRAANAIAEHGFCLLLGEPAVGKSIIAATLAMTALDSWGSLTIRAEDSREVVEHWNPNESNQFFWVDDAFGSVRHERALTDDWARRMPKVMSAINSGAKVVLTSRDYIYREARPALKEYSYPLLSEQQVVIDVADLTRSERQQILYNHIRLGDQSRQVRALLKPHLSHAAEQQPFRPEMARRLGLKRFTDGMMISRSSVVEFMARPSSFLGEVFKQLDSDHIAALALVYQVGDLPRHFDPSAVDAIELLKAVGANLGKLSESLESLNGTFLRCAPKLDADTAGDSWSFRHPTLREGFALYIGENPALLSTFIKGLPAMSVLTQLDCGSKNRRGRLVVVPPSLYRTVALRVFAIGQALTWQNWMEWRVWSAFLADRCSKEFLEIYLSIDQGFYGKALRIGSYLETNYLLKILARLYPLGLLSEDQRLSVVNSVSELAVETPDSGWLDMPELDALLSEGERAAIMSRVREVLIPSLDEELRNWKFNEQGDSTEEYYAPLKEALERYKDELSEFPECVTALEFAISSVGELEAEASSWNNEDVDYDDRTMEDAPFRNADRESGESPVPLEDIRDLNVQDRDIFDDVDS